MRESFVLMASYNEWMNAKIYAAAAELPAEEVVADRGAFFRSILGTLNHIAVGDRIWLSRFATHPSKHAALNPLRDRVTPTASDQILYADLNALTDHRRMLDAVIARWAESLSDADLEHVLSYTTMKGVPASKRFSDLVLHFFNHQSHHRGQITTLLHQAGKDVGVTDLLVLIPDVEKL